MENIDDKAAADALLVVVRRIEAMPGSWHSLTGELEAAVRATVSGRSDALKAYQCLKDISSYAPSNLMELPTQSFERRGGSNAMAIPI